MASPPPTSIIESATPLSGVRKMMRGGESQASPVSPLEEVGLLLKNSGVPPSEVTAVLQDPHNEQERPVTQGRTFLQSLAESGLADTLYSITGAPDTVRQFIGGGRRIGGTFSPSADRVTLRQSRPTEQIKRIFSHEMGHRLYSTVANIKRSGRDSLLQFPGGVPQEDVERLVERVTGKSIDHLTGDFGSSTGERHRASEVFAQAFDQAFHALRKFPDIQKRFPGESLENQIQASLGLVQPLAEPSQVGTAQNREVMEFLLQHPLFKEHPINRLRQVGGQEGQSASRDITRVRGD